MTSSPSPGREFSKFVVFRRYSITKYSVVLKGDAIL